MSAAAGGAGTVRLAWTTRTVEETEALGASLAPHLAAGDLVALTGPLGAGKTRFVAGLARGLEAKARVRSPTFTLVNEYRGRILLVHLDLYRLTPGETLGLGLEDQFERGAVVVEWGEKLPPSLRTDGVAIGFEAPDEPTRVIRAEEIGPRGARLLQAWGAGARR